jgi:hypothetical protein
MDLIGRKLSMQDGVLPYDFFADIETELNAGGAGLEFLTTPLSSALQALKETTDWLVESKQSNPNDSAAAAVDYLEMFGLVTLGYYWLRAAKVASNESGTFYQGKLATAKFFAAKLLPKANALAPVIISGSDSVMSPAEELII